jgi:hypothetical protein
LTETIWDLLEAVDGADFSGRGLIFEVKEGFEKSGIFFASKLDACVETDPSGVEVVELLLNPFTTEVLEDRCCIALILFPGLGGFVMGENGLEKSGVLRPSYTDAGARERMILALLATFDSFLMGENGLVKLGILLALNEGEDEKDLVVLVLLAGLGGFLMGENGLEKLGITFALNEGEDKKALVLSVLLVLLAGLGGFLTGENGF